MLTTFVDPLELNNLNHSKCAVSSCVTSTPLNLLVTALDGRCDVSCCLLVNACSWLPRSSRCLLVDCFLVFIVLCASAGTFGDDESLRSTTPSELDLSTGKDYTLLMIHSISTSVLHASQSLGSMFDPTTCLKPLSNRYSHVPSQQTMYCYVTIARCSARLVCFRGYLSKTMRACDQ